MHVAIQIFLILHFIGLAALFGGWFIQIKDVVAGRARILPGMIHGALLIVISGLVMFGLAIADGSSISHFWVTIKILVGVAILVLLLVLRKKDPVPALWMWAIGALSVFNIAFAVLAPRH